LAVSGRIFYLQFLVLCMLSVAEPALPQGSASVAILSLR
jgi:hypothetical protein